MNMKRKHYIILTLSLIAIAFAVPFLHKRPTTQGEGAENTGRLADIGQGASIPQENVVGHEIVADMKIHDMENTEPMPSDEEILAKIGHEIARLSAISGTFRTDYHHALLKKYEGWTEEQISEREKELAKERLSRVSVGEPYPCPSEEEMELRMLTSERNYAQKFSVPPLIRHIDESNFNAFLEERKVFTRATGTRNQIWMFLDHAQFSRLEQANKEFRVSPHQLVDFRDGEIRFPPDTDEFWNFFSSLCDLMYRSKLTDDDIAKIRQLASEIREMAKTNMPTSAFQMPKRE